MVVVVVIKIRASRPSRLIQYCQCPIRVYREFRVSSKSCPSASTSSPSLSAYPRRRAHATRLASVPEPGRHVTHVERVGRQTVTHTGPERRQQRQQDRRRRRRRCSRHSYDHFERQQVLTNHYDIITRDRYRCYDGSPNRGQTVVVCCSKFVFAGFTFDFFIQPTLRQTNVMIIFSGNVVFWKFCFSILGAAQALVVFETRLPFGFQIITCKWKNRGLIWCNNIIAVLGRSSRRSPFLYDNILQSFPCKSMVTMFFLCTVKFFIYYL